MEANNLYFEPCSSIPYKIVSVLDGHKAFTLQEGTNKLVIQDYKAAPNQLFNVYIYHNNNQVRYALVNLLSNQALWVEGDNHNDGGVVRGDPGQHPSSFFEIEAVSKGDWAGKACFLKTFANGKALDIKGGKANENTEICQWKFHGGANQSWVITPADQLPAPKAEDLGQVPVHPEIDERAIYKVVSILDPSIALTVNKANNEVEVHAYKGTPFQKFTFDSHNGKFALVTPKTKQALCVFGDKQDNAAKIVSDPGQHNSSWFDIVRAEKGPYAHKGYLFKTHAGNRALDLAGGKAIEGKPVLQYNIHDGGNQVWQIVCVQEPKAGNKRQEGEVAPKFKANPNKIYKIVSALDENKVLTITANREVKVATFSDEPTQKFSITQENNKFSFVQAYSHDSVCVTEDKQDNGAKIVSDGNKRNSSWFDIVRADKGPFALKGYLIKTHSDNKAFDIAGGKAEEGKNVLQYNIHQGGNQVWHFEEIVVPNVPGHFKPDANTSYKIVSILNRNIALTIDPQSHKAVVKRFTGDANQTFHINVEKHRYAIVTHDKHALCVFGDKQDNATPIVSDPGKHNSSWFDVARADQGPFTNKGYIIKTHAGNRALDIAGGKAEEGKGVLQYNIHQGGNQVWLFEAVQNQAEKTNQGQQGQGFIPGPGQSIHPGQGFHWAGHFPQVANFFSNIKAGMINQPIAHFAPNQHYIIYAVHGQGLKALDVAQDMANFGNLIVYSFHGAPNQRFTFEREGNAYRIRTVSNGKYVRVTNDDSHDNMWIRTDDKGSKSELWTIVHATEPRYAGKNAYHIRSVFGKALETPGGNLDNSTKIQQGPFNGSEGQTWIIREI